MNYDYTYLSNLFSQCGVTTIEHFILRHKIERVKELSTCNELNLTEIARKMNYSSVARLSCQFKRHWAHPLPMLDLNIKKIVKCWKACKPNPIDYFPPEQQSIC